MLQFYSETVPLRLEEVGLGVVGGVVGSGVDGDEDAGAGRNRYAVDGCSGGGASSDATTEKTRALIGHVIPLLFTKTVDNTDSCSLFALFNLQGDEANIRSLHHSTQDKVRGRDTVTRIYIYESDKIEKYIYTSRWDGAYVFHNAIFYFTVKCQNTCGIVD